MGEEKEEREEEGAEKGGGGSDMIREDRGEPRRRWGNLRPLFHIKITMSDIGQ